MSLPPEVERILVSLTPGERAELLQRLAREIGSAFPGIDSTPGVCGGDPCIVRTRVPVWVLEQARRIGASDADLLRAYPMLRGEDLANAWAYVRSHASEIDEQIRENEAA